MRCPKDQGELAPHVVHGVHALRCPTCGGLWLDDEGFREARDHADPSLSWLEFDLWRRHERFRVAAQGLECPRCAKPLFTLRYGDTGVAIEHCDGCRGVWLDAGEFENIVAALEDEVARMPARDLLAATLREAGDVLRGEGSLVHEWEDVKHVLRLLKLRVLVDNPGLRQMLLQFQRGTPLG